MHKKWGESPLEALSRLRSEENIPEDIPMTYAGRLDPAAEGFLVVLTGEECKKKEEYTKLDKTYRAEIIFGISTDTYDLLGIPTYTGVAGKKFRDIVGYAGLYIEEHHGKQFQKYPPYSSKTVDGVQLHTHAREGRVVEAPHHEVELYDCKKIASSERTREEILSRVDDLTKKVTGDFRQSEIRDAWHTLPAFMLLPSITFELSVSSGFYIRQFAEDLGEALGVSACLYSLVRTGIEKAR